MTLATASKPTHVNPVYGSYFADPFVWKTADTYYAIGTGQLEADGHTLGKVFPLLQSTDFFQWTPSGSALTRPDHRLGDNFWAPAVAEHDGVFYLYYSVGHGDKNHQLRVATSARPQGPYKDTGSPLTDLSACSFAIDPHPFLDDDGSWYLFFAVDFVQESNSQKCGTGLVVARMKTMTELDRNHVPVLRPRHSWQRFQANRPMYGGVYDWHTLEGPCVVKRDGKCYCFFSAGRWENETYGVDYAVAESVLGPYSDSGNESGPRVLRTIPGHLVGPGHNTVTTGPEGADYIVYHAWDKDMKMRQMFIDELLWTEEGPRCKPQGRVVKLVS
jgi:beta-xylosidase